MQYVAIASKNVANVCVNFQVACVRKNALKLATRIRDTEEQNKLQTAEVRRLKKELKQLKYVIPLPSLLFSLSTSFLFRRILLPRLSSALTPIHRADGKSTRQQEVGEQSRFNHTAAMGMGMTARTDLGFATARTDLGAPASYGKK
jgi:hypothetical protein